MIYEYFCERKHGEFEVVQKITDETLKYCPKCEEEGNKEVEVKRLISKSSFILAGGKWSSSGYS